MARRSYTADEKADALALYVELGPGETHRRTGIPKGTLESWAHRAGLQAPAAEKMAAIVAYSKVRIEERKLELAALMLDDVFRLREQLWQPCVTKTVKTVGAGEGTSTVEVVEVDYDKPTFADQALIQKAAAIGIDKVQILTGAATERTEHTIVDDREQVFTGVDELAARRVS